ncbi:MAG: ATP-grasp domain-containing protein, partial [Clostridiales bacterium]|nr:ATP-grasp domain-containing protein [Clostridiales bacterium]
ELIRICRDTDISLIVPTIDTELEILAQNKRRIESETAARVLVSDFDSVAVCCDKIKTAEYFAAHGFGYPKVIDKAMLANKDYEFPLFIKPVDGSSSINAFKVKNEKELRFFLDYIHNPIVQECVAGVEYTADCFSDFDGNVISVVPRIRMQTRSGEILKGKTDKNRAVIDDVKKLVGSFGFIGQTTVQFFLCDNGEIKYIEINPRFGGGAPMSMAVGADSCENLYRLLRGETLEYNEDYEDGVVFARFDNSVRVSGEH